MQRPQPRMLPPRRLHLLVLVDPCRIACQIYEQLLVAVLVTTRLALMPHLMLLLLHPVAQQPQRLHPQWRWTSHSHEREQQMRVLQTLLPPTIVRRALKAQLLLPLLQA
jgi:hypothetical protein